MDIMLKIETLDTLLYVDSHGDIQGEYKTFYVLFNRWRRGLKTLAYFEDSKIVGDQLTYFRNGKTESIRHKEEGDKLYTTKMYHTNGKLRHYFTTTDNGDLHGEAITWNKYGEIYEQSLYISGKKYKKMTDISSEDKLMLSLRHTDLQWIPKDIIKCYCCLCEGNHANSH